MSLPIGELAGLTTSICWSFTSIFFTLSGRQVGSAVVNRTRLVLAFVMVSSLHLITQGELLPLHADPERWGWMAASGVIGFVIGDACLFQAFVMIGPRLSMLLMALNPVMGAVLAWALLSETLAAGEMVGIALAIAGVAWVVTDRRNGRDGLPDASLRYYVIGVLFGLGGALGQASGLIASKKGLEGDFSALSGNLMRLTVATLVIWALAAANGQMRPTAHKLREHPRAIRFILGGAVAGPFLGVWLSLIAVQNAPVGVASTLMSLTPVFLLPLGWLFFKERITRRAVVGTALAVAGTAILFLS
ncbi:MAG: DMT family transporter [Chloroflexi bacterium]|nr:DMT family transporter [Chloroflexota bacterium]